MIRSQNTDLLTVIVYILSTLMTIFLILPLHECAHGFIAYKLGDDTAKREGRLTLNPLAHIDYLGALLMLLIGFGWAKPVPVNPRYFKNPKKGMALTALAGPVSNLLASIAAGLIKNLLVFVCYKCDWSTDGVMMYVFAFFNFLMIMNIGLAVFNFIPVPPLDGSKILMAFLPDKAIFWLNQRTQMLSIGLFVLIMMGGLNGILSVINTFFYQLINWLTFLPFSWAV